MSGTALTIGNFDGVHRGHLSLVRTAREAVGPEGRVVVLTFDPHPAAVLRPGSAPPRLGTLEQRTNRLHAAGVDVVERLDPAGGVLGRTAEEFVDWFVDRFGPAVVVEGADFRFGRGREGSIETLERLGAARGFRVAVVEPVLWPLVNHQLVRVSSSRIRRLLAVGRVRDAAALLGRPWELVGRVVPGEQRGRTIDVPTANLDHGDRLLPADGVYAGVATDPAGQWHPAAVSVGRKPTFGGTVARVCEVHLVDWAGTVDDYGWTMRLRPTEWLRGTMRFGGPGPLVAQLRRDIDRTRLLMTGDRQTVRATRETAP
jgi:riboflavin kinase/FMN adenylyltransferase